MGTTELLLQVQSVPEDEAGDLSAVSARLRDELLDLDVESVDLQTESAAPESAKGLAAIAGWLVVHLGSEGLGAVLAKVADWAFRNDRVVEVTSGGDVLKLGRATRAQQEKIIDAWLARHTPNA